MGIKEKVNKLVFPASVTPAKLAHSRCSENVDWWGEGGIKNESHVVLILADQFGNKINSFSHSTSIY